MTTIIVMTTVTVTMTMSNNAIIDDENNKLYLRKKAIFHCKFCIYWKQFKKWDIQIIDDFRPNYILIMEQ